MDAMKISMSGLNVEWQRLQIIAENLANMNTTKSADGNIYQAKRLVSGQGDAFSEILTQGAVNVAHGVRVVGVEPVAGSERRAFEPNHPHADIEGFVTYPGVNHAEEMTLMVKTSRVYEANLTALSIAQQMYQRAMDMGRS